MRYMRLTVFRGEIACFFGRALYLAVVGVVLQGGTKRMFYRTTYTGRRNDSAWKK